MKFDNKISGVSTNNNESSITMSIDPIMGMALVTKYLYTNPIKSLTQEYIANAKDANRLTNRTNKDILITLPTIVEPTLKIRDHGPGLSLEKIEDVFAKLGKSDKRESSNQGGGFGIGGKSGFAYTDSFMIRSLINGEENLYLAYFVENQAAKIDHVNTKKTEEPNGVEVMIPIKKDDISKFIEAVYSCIYFWEEKPQILGLEDHELPQIKALPNCVYEGSKFKVYKRREFWSKFGEAGGAFGFSAFILIDEVPYRINLDRFEEFKKESSLFRIKNQHINNDLSFVWRLSLVDLENYQISLNNLLAPNREELNENDSVQKLISQLCLSAEVDLGNHILEKIKNCQTLHDFYELKSEIKRNFNTVFDNQSTFQLTKNTKITYIPDPDRYKSCFKFYYKEEELKFLKERKIKNKYILEPYNISRLSKTDLFFTEFEETPELISKKIKHFFKEKKENYHSLIITPNVEEEVGKDLESSGVFKNFNKYQVPVVKRVRKEKKEVIAEKGEEKTNDYIILPCASHNGYSLSFSKKFSFKINDLSNLRFVELPAVDTQTKTSEAIEKALVKNGYDFKMGLFDSFFKDDFNLLIKDFVFVMPKGTEILAKHEIKTLTIEEMVAKWLEINESKINSFLIKKEINSISPLLFNLRTYLSTNQLNPVPNSLAYQILDLIKEYDSLVNEAIEIHSSQESKWIKVFGKKKEIIEPKANSFNQKRLQIESKIPFLKYISVWGSNQNNFCKELYEFTNREFHD